MTTREHVASAEKFLRGINRHGIADALTSAADKVDLVLNEARGLGWAPPAATRSEREKALVRMTTARTAAFMREEDLVALHIHGNGMELSLIHI